MDPLQNKKGITFNWLQNSKASKYSISILGDKSAPYSSSWSIALKGIQFFYENNFNDFNGLFFNCS